MGDCFKNACCVVCTKVPLDEKSLVICGQIYYENHFILLIKQQIHWALPNIFYFKKTSIILHFFLYSFF